MEGYQQNLTTKKNQIPNKEELQKRLREIISKKKFFDILKSTSLEVSQADYEKIQSINEWRKKSKDSPARDFYRLFEEFTSLKSEKLSANDEKFLTSELSNYLSVGARKLSPRSYDLFQAILASFENKDYKPNFDITSEKIKELTESGDIKYLISPNVELKTKLAYLSKRFDDYVAGVRVLDDNEREEKKEEVNSKKEEKETSQNQDKDQTPPPSRDDSKPSMDEMNRPEEGEKVLPIWTIKPPYGGYFREQSFDTWDFQKKIWKQSEYVYQDVPLEGFAYPEKDSLQMDVNLQEGVWVRIPSPSNHKLAGFMYKSQFEVECKKDQNGDCLALLKPSGKKFFRSKGLTKLSFVFRKGKQNSEESAGLTQDSNEQFIDSTEKIIKEIQETYYNNRDRAFAFARHTMSHLRYSNDSSFNEIYNSEEKGYGFAIDTHREADCDVGNTYFAFLCMRLGIPVRHVVGHMVKGKNEDGVSMITSGTGHGWSEIWDDETNEWLRIDATPPGDTLLEEENKDSEEESELVPGDYGEQEAVGPTDEELVKIEELLAKKFEAFSFTPSERKLAEETGIELSEARRIISEIELAEDVRLKDGRRVVDALGQLFDMIIDSRKHFKHEYEGPLRKREGGEYIGDVVSHYVGMVSDENDPLSREREEITQQEEKLFGGFDVYFIADKSASMDSTVNREAKLKIQQRTLYLLLNSLHRFEDKLEKSGVQEISDKSLGIRTESISFRGSSQRDIDIDKPLSDNFSAKDKVHLWKSLSQSGGGNGDVTALKTIYGEIKKEVEAKEKTREKDNRLRIVFAMTDGSPDSVIGVHQAAEELGKLGAVVVGIGLTETAKAVKQIYTTDYSYGDYVDSIDDLPVMVGKYIIKECMRLFPQKTKEQNERLLNSLLASFTK